MTSINYALEDTCDIHELEKLHIIMPWCACASEVYGSVFVCVCVCVCMCVCVECYIHEVQVRARILVMFSWIFICEFAK